MAPGLAAGASTTFMGRCRCFAVSKPSASITMSPMCSRRSNGSAWCRTPTVDGAKPADRMTILRRAVLGQVLLPRLRGRLWACWPAETRSESVQRGILYVLETQRPDGRWDEQHYTGTGFPRVFYLAYHLYRDYFPLIALSTYSREFSTLYKEGGVGYARG